MAIYKEGQIVTPQQNSRERAAAQGTYGLYANAGAVTTSSSLTVAVSAIASGAYVINDTVETTAYGGGTIASDAADSTHPRIDVVIVNQSGTVSITKGSAAADPEAPDIGAGDLALAELYLASQDTAYASSDIFDMREIIGQRKGRKSTDVVAATSPVILVDEFADITGTTTIAGLPARVAGWEVEFQFDAATPLTHNGTSFILDGGVSRTTAAGDIARFRCLDGTNWKETVAQPGSTRLDQAVSNFVKSGRGSLHLVGASGVQSAALADNDLVGLGTEILMHGTGTVTGAANAEMPGAFQLFVTASGDDAGFYMTNQLLPANDWVIGCRVKMNASASGQTFFLGLHDSPVNFTDNNNILGWRVVNTGNYIGVCDNGGTESTVDSSNNDTNEHVLEIRISGGGASVGFYFDGTQVGSEVTSNISTTAAIMMCGLTGTDAADHWFFVSDIYAYRGN